jgi:hypothetical protein
MTQNGEGVGLESSNGFSWNACFLSETPTFRKEKADSSRKEFKDRWLSRYQEELRSPQLHKLSASFTHWPFAFGYSKGSSKC